MIMESIEKADRRTRTQDIHTGRDQSAGAYAWAGTYAWEAALLVDAAQANQGDRKAADMVNSASNSQTADCIAVVNDMFQRGPQGPSICRMHAYRIAFGWMFPIWNL